MNIAVAFSSQENSRAAVRDVVLKIKSQIGGEVDFCLALAGERFPPDLISELKLTLNSRTFVCGVSSEVIFNEEMSGFGLVLVAFNATESLGYRTYLRGERNRFDIEKALRDSAYKKFTRQGAVFGFIPEPFQREDFISAVGAVFGRSFPFVGIYPWNSSGRFLSLHNEEVVSNAVTGGLIIGQDLQVAIGSTHGFKPIGIPFQFARIQEEKALSVLSGDPAYEVYRHYFKDKPRPSEEHAEEMRHFFNMYPLGFRTDDGLAYTIAVPTRVMVDGSLEVRGRIFNDRIVRLMFSTPALTLESSRNLIKELRSRIKHITLAFVVESIHRLRILYPETGRELALIREALGRNVPMVGLVSDYQLTSLSGESPHSANVVNSGLSIMLLGNN